MNVHYVEGNINALKRFHMLRKVAEQFGIEKDRIQLLWASASEGNILAEKVNNMTIQLKSLGVLKWDTSPTLHKSFGTREVL